jgi:hypothetical protein
MSLEMAHKVILPPKKNYIPQFLKQRDINSYKSPSYNLIEHFVRALSAFSPSFFLNPSTGGESWAAECMFSLYLLHQYFMYICLGSCPTNFHVKI